MSDPQIIPGLPMAEYQAMQALSAGGIHALVEECPARFWYDSPWNPNREPDNKPEFDIGTALHLAILEPADFAERVVLIDQDDYRTKEARDRRDEAWAAGKSPLKPKEAAIVVGMSIAVAQKTSLLFADGEAETTLAWDWSGVPCKARPDYLSRDRKTIVDAKTAATANPEAIARKAFSEGWHVRAAWYREAVAAVTGIVPERYIFVVVEKDKPHLVETFELDERAEEWGRQIIRAGLRKFAVCSAVGIWPGYGDGTIKIGLPTWAEYRLADREQAGEFAAKIDQAAIRRSNAWMEP